ncbi:hypothetical protein HN51_042305 [Arachis hypogaea]
MPDLPILRLIDLFELVCLSNRYSVLVQPLRVASLSAFLSSMGSVPVLRDRFEDLNTKCDTVPLLDCFNCDSRAM